MHWTSLYKAVLVSVNFAQFAPNRCEYLHCNAKRNWHKNQQIKHTPKAPAPDIRPGTHLPGYQTWNTPPPESDIG